MSLAPQIKPKAGAPFFTVVTPAFNSERFIGETMRTVAMQREGGRVRVEHVVMDGGSTDRTAEIVAQWSHPDTRYVRQPDAGPADAINRGLALARGDFLCWLNSDDEYLPYALERAAYVLGRHPRRAFCFGHCPIIDAHGREIRRFVTRFKNFFFPISCHAFIRTLNYISQPAVVFRRTAWEKAGPLRTDMKAAWDYELWLRLWRQGGGVMVPHPDMACFRWTPGSISGSSFECQFREELDAAQADAGVWAPTSIVHHALVHAVVFLYKHLSRHPKPVAEERIDQETPETMDFPERERPQEAVPAVGAEAPR